MMFLVQRRLFCILPCNKSTIHLSSYELCSLFSFSTSKDQSSDHKSNITVVDPLQSCEPSSEKPAKTAKCRTRDTKSSSSSLNIEFFKQSGWSGAQVMKLMQRDPRFLRAKVETVLKPRMRSLQDMGFSDTEIAQLVSSCPSVLRLRDIRPRINFWRSLLGSNERLIKACGRNMFLLTFSLSRKIEPNISLLRQCRTSEQHMAQMVGTLPTFSCQTEKIIKEAIEYVEVLGVSRDHKMFPRLLELVTTTSRSKFDATFATLISFGWTRPDCVAAFRRVPSIWCLSKKTLSDKMTFLTKEAGCELTYIIDHPVLLTYSLEKRLRPRYEVMNFLDQNKLLEGGHQFTFVRPSYIMLSEKRFRKRFLILLSEEKFIAVYDSYVAAVQGKHDVVAEN